MNHFGQTFMYFQFLNLCVPMANCSRMLEVGILKPTFDIVFNCHTFEVPKRMTVVHSIDFRFHVGQH